MNAIFEAVIMDDKDTISATIRVISWNCRGASLGSGLWDFLLELDPDVAVLQDFRTIPDRVLQVYFHAKNSSVTTTERAPRHFTGMLLKGVTTADIHLPAPHEWVASELEQLKEFFTAKSVTLHWSEPQKANHVQSQLFWIGGRMTARRRSFDVSRTNLQS
jgi:hypothetical protein